jgi:hypothetical protein
MTRFSSWLTRHLIFGNGDDPSSVLPVTLTSTISISASSPEDPENTGTYYRDFDEDGYGDPESPSEESSLPTGYVKQVE